MTATSPKEPAPLPDPQEIAKTYAEVAQRASKLLTDHIHRQPTRIDNPIPAKRRKHATPTRKLSAITP